MVDEEELEDTLLRFLHHRRLSVDNHAVIDPGGARRHQHAAPWAHDLHQTHATQRNRIHTGMPTEPGDIVAILFGNLDQYLAGGPLHFDPIDSDGD